MRERKRSVCQAEVYRIRPNACTREERMSGYHGDHLVDWSGYADDLKLFLENVNDLQKALTILHSVFSKFGLHINIKKTETMIFNCGPKRGPQP